MKRNVLFLFALALGLTACSEKNNFKVNVSLANGNERTVYLQKFVDNAPVTIGQYYTALVSHDMAQGFDGG